MILKSIWRLQSKLLTYYYNLNVNVCVNQRDNTAPCHNNKNINYCWFLFDRWNWINWIVKSEWEGWLIIYLIKWEKAILIESPEFTIWIHQLTAIESNWCFFLKLAVVCFNIYMQGVNAYMHILLKQGLEASLVIPLFFKESLIFYL